MLILSLIFLIAYIWCQFKPKFDYTRKGWILLWIYVKRQRKYIKIIKVTGFKTK